MKLYIKIKDGIPEGHPLLEENLISAFPEIDLNNLPDDWAEFQRISIPSLAVYEVYDRTEYELNSQTGVYQDKHIIRQMTDSEKIAKQEQFKSEWNSAPTSAFASWIFNADMCRYDPPVSPPESAFPNQWLWKESDLNWVSMPTKPDDGKNYYLDVVEVIWKELV